MTAPRAAIEGFLDDIQTGWRNHVLHERFGRQLTVAYNRPLPGVAAIPAAVPDCRGVFVAGDWLGGPELLADASISSGAVAARLATS